MAFIGSYKVDREQTRFYQDFGLEQALDGKKAPSMSVKEAEKALEPYVRAMADAGNSRDRGRAEEKLETFIKRNLYESNVPTRTQDGAPNRPQDLFVYRGRPDIAIRRAVVMQMNKVGPSNEAQVKSFLMQEQRNPTIRSLHMLSAQPGPAQNALSVLKEIAQRDFGAKLQQEHGHKPLAQVMEAVAKQPMSAEQERIGRFGKALVEGVSHPNPAMSAKAHAIVSELVKLDGSKATLQDVAKVSSAVSAKFASAEAGAQKSVESKAPAPAAPRTSSSMDR